MEGIKEQWEWFVREFLISRKIANRSPETLDWYERRLKPFVEFCLKRNETPLTFTEKTVREFVSERSEKISPVTVNGELKAIRVFCNFLIRFGFREDNPASKVEKLKEPAQFPRTLNDEQITALLETAAQRSNTFTGLRDLTLIALLLDTGIRISEALNMKLSDVDLEQGFIRVVGKGNKERFVPVGDSVRVLLHRYLLRRKGVRVAGDWLFINSLGLKYKKRQAQHNITRLGKLAGIKGVRVSAHTLRFTFVRKWLQSGGDSIVLQRILGHSSSAMTSYYARLFASDLKEVHKRHSPIDQLGPLVKKLPRQRIV